MQIRGGQTEVDAIPRQNFAHVAAADYGERVKPEDTGHESFGFDVGEAAGTDGKLVISIRSAMRTLAVSTSRMVRPRRARRERRFCPAVKMAILLSGACKRKPRINRVP